MKKTFFILLFFIIFYTLLVSAKGVSISPDSFSFEAMPGESFQKNISITTSGIYAVKLNLIGTDQNITINTTEPFIVDKEKNFTISFIVGTDIPIGVYNLELQAETDIIEKIIETEKIISSGGGGGGIRTIYRNQTINQTEINELIKENKTTIGFLTNKIDSLEEGLLKESGNNERLSRRIIFLSIFSGILVVTIFYIRFKSPDKTRDTKELKV